MPNRIWNEELQSWVMIDEGRFALQTKVVDVGEYYKSDNVEGCLQELGDKLENFDGESIEAIGELESKIEDLDDRVTYIEENGGGTGPGGLQCQH